MSIIIKFHSSLIVRVHFVQVWCWFLSGFVHSQEYFVSQQKWRVSECSDSVCFGYFLFDVSTSRFSPLTVWNYLTQLSRDIFAPIAVHLAYSVYESVNAGLYYQYYVNLDHATINEYLSLKSRNIWMMLSWYKSIHGINHPLDTRTSAHYNASPRPILLASFLARYALIRPWYICKCKAKVRYI